MKRGVRNFLLLLGACAAGWVASDALYRASWSRDAIGYILGRGQFRGLANGWAIHERDLFRPGDGRAETMLAAEALRNVEGGRRIADAEVERELKLLRAQFETPAVFQPAMARAGLNDESLRELVRDHLKVRGWLEARVTAQTGVTEEEMQRVFEKERGRFQLPDRRRASHIFVAAPEGTPEEVVAQKRDAALGLSVRLLAGETMEALAAEASEDEATKNLGGDLGYFSAHRMPPDFLTELEKLSVGQTSPPVRCHLGFHIIRLTDVRPARELTFEEARAEIAGELANQKRATAVTAITGLVRLPDWTPEMVARP